ncbi:GxxExxY protein [Pedobacter sp.]
MNFISKQETFEIIGLYMEVHNNLGAVFLEIVYKDALEYEFQARISSISEKSTL